MKINGMQIQVVREGHTFYSDLSDKTLVVTDGNPVLTGNNILYVTENDYPKLKERIANEQN
jgi:hypothetical protein